MTFFTETSLSACTCVGIRWPRNFFLMVMTCHLTAPAMPIMRDDELCNLSYSCFFFNYRLSHESHKEKTSNDRNTVQGKYWVMKWYSVANTFPNECCMKPSLVATGNQ